MNSEKQISLSNSQKMPLVGFGTYLISNEEAPSTVGNALHNGYRHVDTAEAYSNERGVGKALLLKQWQKNMMFQKLKYYFAGRYKKVIR